MKTALRELADTLIRIDEGKPWQFYNLGWINAGTMADPIRILEAGGKIRLKPRKLGRTVNGHTLPPGASWHRSDFTEDMLPAPYRPLMLGEKSPAGDEILGRNDKWRRLGDSESDMLNSVTTRETDHCRTTRPIPFTLTPEQINDGWIPWSDGECPVEPESRPTVMYGAGLCCAGKPAGELAWAGVNHVIAYKPDPYGKLRQALAEGKVIEYKPSVGSHWHQIDKGMEVGFIAPPEFYRIKEPQCIPIKDQIDAVIELLTNMRLSVTSQNE